MNATYAFEILAVYNFLFNMIFTVNLFVTHSFDKQEITIYYNIIVSNMKYYFERGTQHWTFYINWFLAVEID